MHPNNPFYFLLITHKHNTTWFHHTTLVSHKNTILQIVVLFIFKGKEYFYIFLNCTKTSAIT